MARIYREVEVEYESLPPGIGARWRYKGEIQWNLRSIPQGAHGILINPRYPEEEQLAKATAFNDVVRRLVEPLHNFGKLFHDVMGELKLLDDFAHDETLNDAALEEIGCTRDRPVDPIGSHYRKAHAHAAKSLAELEKALAELEGLHRGEDKDRYEEPLRRSVQGARLLLERMTEMKEGYEGEERRKPYMIRQARLSGLVVKLTEFLALFAPAKELDRQFEPENPRQLFAIEKRFQEVKRRLSKLRDNPSRKMKEELLALAEELDNLHGNVWELSDNSAPWLSGYEHTTKWLLEEPREKPSVTAAKRRHWLNRHTVQYGNSRVTSFVSQCDECWPYQYEVGTVPLSCLAAE